MIASTSHAKNGSPSILLIDASRNIREFCKRELEREGYQVSMGGREAEVWEALRQDPPDLIVLDIRFPRVDGLELIERIASRHPAIPVIFYTTRRDYLGDPRTRLARACVEKSENLRELKATIAQVLGPHTPKG